MTDTAIAQPKQLEERLLQCMARDQPRLRRELNRLRGSDKGPEIARLRDRIERSARLRETRAASVPKIGYAPELPISALVGRIAQTLREHQVLVLSGETGSGKTTQIPKICLELGRGIAGMIGHTQPRRVAARTVAARIAEELGDSSQSLVGYQVRFADRTGERTLIKLMTDGILLAETAGDPDLLRYDTIIVDEAHERSLNIDFLLGYLKRLLRRRRDLKLIVTSATIDVERFARHFDGAPVVEVSGRTYPVEVLYRPPDRAAEEAADQEELRQRALLAAVDECMALDRASKGRRPPDILIFLPGEREIREASLMLRKALQHRPDQRQTSILPLYSRLSTEEQNRVFESHAGRRIVLATNVAETSLTVPGIGYVIDPGIVRINRYSYRSKIQRLPLEPVSQASAEQRKGRCGRVAPGVCIRLYDEADLVARPAFTDPEIRRVNLASVILQMLALRLGEIGHFPFVEPPDNRSINDAYQLLRELRAVDAERKVTTLGRVLARFPIDLKLARMAVAAAETGCLKEVLIIVSALAVQDPRERPHEKQQAADERHRQHWHPGSDFMAFVNLWNRCEAVRQDSTASVFRKWCRDQFLSFTRLHEWRETHRELHLLCRELGYEENRAPAEVERIHQALLSGLLGNLGFRQAENDYLGPRGKRLFIFPGSSQFTAKPRWIMAAEVVETSRVYARIVAAIDPAWIEPLAEHLVSRTYTEPHWEKKSGRVMALENVNLHGLPVVRGRRVDYGPIDPVHSRQIFIESALVERQLQTRAGFYTHNLRMLDEVEQLEARSRRRDLSIDPQSLYGFYEANLPAEVWDRSSLESWLSRSPKNVTRRLYLTEDFVRGSAPAVEAEFPATIQLQQARLPLEYRFEPGTLEDGVTVSVPVGMLQQVPAKQLDWLVPGYLRQKCLALLKSLPKALRRQFVPAPEFVDRALEGLAYDGRSLSESLAERLFRISGCRIPADAWNPAVLESHLTMNIRVIGEDGRLLAQGRNLQRLKEQFLLRAEAEPPAAGASSLLHQGLRAWSFGELPEWIELEQAGVKLRAFPGLVDKGDSVDVQLFEHPATAAQHSMAGLLRLILLELPQQRRHLSANLPRFSSYSLYYVTLGKAEELRTDLVDAIFRYRFVEGRPIPRNRMEFDQRLQLRADLMEMAEEVTACVEPVLFEHHRLKNRLNELRQRPALERSVRDAEQQLTRLVHQGFLCELPLTWLKAYPRFLKALSLRLERLQPERENRVIDELDKFWEKYQTLSKATRANCCNALQTFRWMIEEYRVSLFAQSLGTSMPVSAKRLERQCLQVKANLEELT